MGKDLHATEFQNGTLQKLELYRMYLRKWIPVFVRSNSPVQQVNIFDFFCGPGVCPAGNSGSPLIAMEELEPYHDKLVAHRINLTLYLNDSDQKKVDELRLLLPDPKNVPYKIVSISEDFPAVYSKWRPQMNSAANLIFLDQNGVKHITPEVFQDLVSIRFSDFLFFISSSYLRRFRDNDSFIGHLGISPQQVSSGDYSCVHRNITDHYRKLLPQGSNYFVAPFSIKKGANIHGLIFGSGNPLGILKFLECTWDLDPDTGDSNYDIDKDNLGAYRGTPQQVFSFMEKLPTKVEVFENELEQAILSGALKTDHDILIYALERGFIGRHIIPVVNKLKKEELIEVPGGKRLRFSKVRYPEYRAITVTK